MPYSNAHDKITALLYHVANTQNQLKIDKIAITYKRIIQDDNCTTSFANFVNKINAPESDTINFTSLYNGIKSQEGLGKKTAALFTKILYHLHNGEYANELKIWDDVPTKIGETDNLYLPVDAVIISIFSKMDETTIWNFDRINELLKTKYNNQQMEVWDDLWFWGFITQNGSGGNRQFGWNENKYWALKESDKNAQVINEIKTKAEIFLKIIANNK